MVNINKKGKQNKSKRQKLNMKYKITKKVSASNRKLKKEAKKLKALGLFKKKRVKDPPLPNLYPFKAQIMESLERKQLEEEQQLALERLQKKEKPLPQLDNLEEENNKPEMEEEEYISKYMDANVLKSLPKDNRKFYKELYKVVEASDIILIVLDARHPLECRSKTLEAKIQSMPGEKKIIMVLNKIDLVPEENASDWLSFLRREYATVLFKSNTQNQSTNLGGTKLFKKSLKERKELAGELTSSSKAVGAENLLELIKNYSKKEGIMQAVTVGVIGFPNVGKSSVINSLKRSKSAAVSSVPGFTRNIQEIQIEKKIKVIDSPGVIFATAEETGKLSTMNIMKIEQIKDFKSAVEAVISKLEKDQLLQFYKIGDFTNVISFLAQVAVARGKLQKKGIADLEAAARIVLHDWNSGRLKYYSLVPNNQNQMAIE